MTIKVSDVTVKIDPKVFEVIINRAVRGAIGKAESTLERTLGDEVHYEVSSYLERQAAKTVRAAVRQALKAGLK